MMSASCRCSCCDAARAIAAATLPAETQAALFDRLFQLGEALPPAGLDVLIEARPLPPPVTAVLAHLRAAMASRGLLATWPG